MSALTSSNSVAVSDAQATIDPPSQSAVQVLQKTHIPSSRANISDLLPNEILQKILIEVVQPYNDFLPTSWQSHAKLAAVCRAWRHVLLGYPAFWTCIPLYPNGNLEQMLARSMDEPLAIRLNLLFAKDEAQLLQSLYSILAARQLAEFHLFANGHYYDGPANVLQVIDKGLSHETPTLRSLKLLLVDVTKSHPAPELPPKVLCTVRPMLKHLDLVGCKIDWRALRGAIAANNCISNLLTLRLQSLCPQPPIDILAGIPRPSPNLQTLDVAHKAIPIDIASYNAQHGPASINLHSLQSCYLSDNPSLTAEMLLALSMPEGVRLDVFAASDRERVTGNHNDEEDFEQAASRILDECSISSSKPDRRGSTVLHLVAFEDTHWSTVMSCVLFPWENTSDTGPEPLENVRVQGPTSGFRRMQQLVCAPQVETLRVSWTHRGEGYLKIIQSNSDHDDWLAFFERHPVLASISIDSDHHEFAHSLIRALHLAFKRNLGTSKPLLSKLRAVSFRRVAFQPYELVWIRKIFSAMCSQAGDEVQRYRVRFKGCTIGDAKWNGKLPRESDPEEDPIALMQYLTITKETESMWDRLGVVLS